MSPAGEGTHRSCSYSENSRPEDEFVTAPCSGAEASHRRTRSVSPVIQSLRAGGTGGARPGEGTGDGGWGRSPGDGGRWTRSGVLTGC